MISKQMSYTLIDNFHMEDNRGGFTKVFNDTQLKKQEICFECKEIYYSASGRNVIRGMHYQSPPYEHDKIVHVLKGRVLDVILDIRKKSPNYGKSYFFELTEQEHKALYIPKGYAHGFKSLEDNSIMLYCVSSIYNPERDAGIRWNSFGFDWEIENPIISEKDMLLIDFQQFKSPFI